MVCAALVLPACPVNVRLVGATTTVWVPPMPVRLAVEETLAAKMLSPA